MAQVLNGEHANLEVRGVVTVNGALNGATVRRSSSLTMNGALSGHLVIEEDGVVLANGAIAGLTAENDGIIMLTGAIELNAAEFDNLGRVIVMPGSIVARQILGDDGSLQPVRPAEKINIDAGRDDAWCAWLSEEHAFVPVAEIRRRNAEAETNGED